MPVELHAASAFSFLRASSLPEDLVERAARLGYTAVALVDRDGVSGRPALLQGGARRGRAADRRRRAEPGGRRGAAAARRDAAGLPQPLPADHADEGRRSEGGGAAPPRDAGGPRGGAGGPAGRRHAGGVARPPGGGPTRAGHRPPGAARRGLRPGAAWCSTCSGTAAASRRRRTRRSSTWPTRSGLRAVATNGVRHAAPKGRALLDVLTCIREKRTLATAGRLPGRERRAPPQAAGGDGRALRRPARPAAQRRGARRAARVHARGPRLPLPRLPGAGGGDADLVPVPGDGGGRARALPARTTRRPAGRSSASWRSSGSWASPATS